VKRCEKYLQFLSFLEQLLKLGIKKMVTLREFFNPNSIEKLISHLLKHDFIELAINLCELCSVNPAKIVLIWVRLLMSLQKYEKARELLAKNLEILENIDALEIQKIVRRLEDVEFQHTGVFLEQMEQIFSVIILTRKNFNK
jgi:hypothetical protein